MVRRNKTLVTLMVELMMIYICLNFSHDERFHCSSTNLFSQIIWDFQDISVLDYPYIEFNCSPAKSRSINNEL